MILVDILLILTQESELNKKSLENSSLKRGNEKVAISNINTIISNDIQKVWNIVLAVDKYNSWRSDFVQNIENKGSSVYLRIMMENLCRVYYNDCKCF